MSRIRPFLLHTCLTRSSLTHTEHVWHLGQPCPLAAHENLYQDFEAHWLEVRMLDDLPTNEEESAHRVAARAHATKERSGGKLAPTRDRLPVPSIQPGATAARDIAARDDDIGVLGGVHHRRQLLRWMLKIAVQDRDQCATRVAHALDNRGGEAAGPVLRLAMQQTYRRISGCESVHNHGRVVVAVIREEDFVVQRAQRRRDPDNERLDVLALIACRDNQR